MMPDNDDAMTDKDFLTICRERGFIHQCTDEAGLQNLLHREKPVAAYIGFDCTAPSLHAGSLLQIMMLRWWQRCGHKPIVLIGGATTKIGDPSGKDHSRQLLDDAAIERNMAGIKQVFAKFLEFEDSSHDSAASRNDEKPALASMTYKARMVNNDDWLKDVRYIDLLREVGPHFSVNRMLTMDSVRQRLERESHLSFLEFNYMVLQAYDFVKLGGAYDCRVQFGGSDQWGNIVMGCELNRRLMSLRGSAADEAAELKTGLPGSARDTELFGLTTPLLTTASGAKMGKTAAGAIWLNDDPDHPEYSCSPYDYWQYWRNTEDADVERFLKLFTELELENITALMQGNINDAKTVLATETTALLHGRKAAENAAKTAARVFGSGGTQGLPEVTITRAELVAGIPAFKLLQMAGLAESGGAARRLIKGKGARLNNEVIEQDDQLITLEAMEPDGVIKLSSGKKKHILLRPV